MGKAVSETSLESNSEAVVEADRGRLEELVSESEKIRFLAQDVIRSVFRLTEAVELFKVKVAQRYTGLPEGAVNQRVPLKRILAQEAEVNESLGQSNAQQTISRNLAEAGVRYSDLVAETSGTAKPEPAGFRNLMMRIEDTVALAKGETKASLMERVKKAILRKVPDAQAWAGMTDEGVDAFRLFGLTLPQLSRLLREEPERDSANSMRTLSRRGFLKLGRNFFGSKHECLHTRHKRKELEPEQCISEIIKLVPTLDDWMAMTPFQKRHFHVHGSSLAVIARSFGIENVPNNLDSENFKALGRLIYE